MVELTEITESTSDYCYSDKQFHEILNKLKKQKPIKSNHGDPYFQGSNDNEASTSGPKKEGSGADTKECRSEESELMEEFGAPLKKFVKTPDGITLSKVLFGKFGITDEVEEDKEDVSIRKEGIRMIVREMKRYIDAIKAMKSSTTGEGGSSHDKLEERTIKDTQILNSNKKATTSEGGSSHDQLEERTIKELTQILNSNKKAATTSEGGSSHDQLEERMIKELTQILNSNKKAISDRMDLLTTRMGRLEESDTPDGMTPSKDKDTGKGASVEIVEFDCCYKAFWSNSTTFKGLQKGHSRVEANLGRGEKKKEDKMEEGKSKNKKKDCKPENKKRHNV